MLKNTTFVALGLLALSLLMIPACDWFKKTDSVGTQESTLRIIDVNTDEVFNDAHIDGAVHVGVNDLEQAAQKWNKNDTLVVYCSDYNCMASHNAAKTLSNLGFTDVAVYSGGINEWYKLSKDNKERYPVVGSAKMEFLEKDVEKVTPQKEEMKTVSADELAQHIENMKKKGLAA